MMLIKNIFVCIASIICISIVIIILDKLGMNKSFNLIFSAMLYGIFTTLYFQKKLYCLLCIFSFYLFLFTLSESFEVLLMLLISLCTFYIIKQVMPQLKDKLQNSTLKSNYSIKLNK
ncbi:hypothetical protein O1449_06540 [Acinetobacter sp. TR3]|nr:hypothetical protein [Acinetobacter sp. TR3]WAU77809.1 hypothetical protein O1449_06540 [Acinetobacter sp. TR3]